MWVMSLCIEIKTAYICLKIYAEYNRIICFVFYPPQQNNTINCAVKIRKNILNG